MEQMLLEITPNRDISVDDFRAMLQDLSEQAPLGITELSLPLPKINPLGFAIINFENGRNFYLTDKGLVMAFTEHPKTWQYFKLVPIDFEDIRQ